MIPFVVLTITAILSWIVFSLLARRANGNFEEMAAEAERLISESHNTVNVLNDEWLWQFSECYAKIQGHIIRGGWTHDQRVRLLELYAAFVRASDNLQQAYVESVSTLTEENIESD